MKSKDLFSKIKIFVFIKDPKKLINLRPNSPMIGRELLYKFGGKLNALSRDPVIGFR